MYTLVIADDELNVLNSLKNSINWAALQFKVVGTATDGIKALKVVKEKNPDVIMTDVVMPGMDGLDLVKNIKQAGIHTKFVILSAYDEFKYAQKAVRYGVKEYLLKPFDDEDIFRVFRIIKDELDSGTKVQNANNDPVFSFNEADSIILQAKNHIRQNISVDISLTETAKILCINPSYLSYAFKKETGINFCDYVNYVRLERAKELLKASKFRVKEIAQLVGYDNYAYFCRIFRKSEGLTPLEYRATSPVEENI